MPTAGTAKNRMPSFATCSFGLTMAQITATNPNRAIKSPERIFRFARGRLSPQAAQLKAAGLTEEPHILQMSEVFIVRLSKTDARNVGTPMQSPQSLRHSSSIMPEGCRKAAGHYEPAGIWAAGSR